MKRLRKKKKSAAYRYPPEVIEYAKALWLQMANNGTHVYTRQEICNMIEKEARKPKSEFSGLKQCPNASTIYRWSIQENEDGESWEDLWKKGQRHGISQVKVLSADRAKEMEQDELLINKIEQITQVRASTAVKIMNAVNNFLEGVIPKPEIDPITKEPKKEQPIIITDEKTCIQWIRAYELIFSNLNFEEQKAVVEKTESVFNRIKDFERLREERVNGK